MAFITERIHNHGRSAGDYFLSAREWIATHYAEYRLRRELAQAEAELRAFSDAALADIGLSRGEIHDAVWYGRKSHRS